MRVVLFSKFTAQTGCSINAPSGLPVKGPCSARCFGENGGFWADMGAGVPLTGLGGVRFPAQWDKYTAPHQTAGQQRDFKKG